MTDIGDTGAFTEGAITRPRAKDSLRQRILSERFKLSSGERKAKSRSIEERLFSLPEFRDARAVMFYASFRSEVKTWDMIRRALKSGKRVFLPKVKGKGLSLFEIKDFDKDVEPGAWGIPEPNTGIAARMDDIDLVIVPGSVFDEKGNRLGYGAGYYDRLLAGYDGMTVGLAFELQIAPEVPAGPHDVPVKKIVTEKRVITVQSA